jgi:hypothetical protein
MPAPRAEDRARGTVVATSVCGDIAMGSFINQD